MSEQQPVPQATSPLSSFFAQVSAFVARLTARQKLIGGAAIVAAIVVFLLAGSLAGREITINGYRLSEQEVAYLDAIAGGQVPSGNYWLDPQTMAWGVVGNAQPMGVIGYGGAQAGAQGQAPHWADVGQNYRGPFGDYMSDGKCSAVNGILVGDC